jgi:Flp pilus assembly protein TadG
MIEFALCSTVLLLMFVAGSDVARLFTLGTTVTQAAKAATQYAAFSTRNAQNMEGIAAAARAAAPGVTLNVVPTVKCYCDGLVVACNAGCGSQPNTMYSNVTVTSTYQSFFPISGSTSIAVVGAARMRVR